jgi:shikimate kinase
MKRNISLIGMAGVGKSFTSKILASKLGYEYVCIDKIIAEEAHKLNLNTYLLSDSDFISLEEKATCSLRHKVNAVIDTGGSVVYSQKSMDILSKISFIVYLTDSLENIKRRFDSREEHHLVGMAEGVTFEKLLLDRDKLYSKYSNSIINISEHSDDLINKIIKEYNLN